MSTSGSVFSDTLQQITNTKLAELSSRRHAFEEAKASLLSDLQGREEAIERLQTLSNGIKKALAIKLDKAGKVVTKQTKNARLEIELKNLDRFLAQARCDPSVSANMMKKWEQSLFRHLGMQSNKFQYAALYGQLVTEWLEGENEPEDIEMEDSFEDIGDAKKMESRAEWEKMVFEPAVVDKAALEQYLGQLFVTDEDDTAALKALRQDVYQFESNMSSPSQFTTVTLKWVIRSLVSSDLLSDEKREVLKDFETNDIVLKEISDVLNMRIGTLNSWTWNSGSPVNVEMRRKISGVYNIHMHEDLLQAIFLQYIGVKWSVFFKRALRKFRNSEGAWKSAQTVIPKIDRQRMGYYLGHLDRSRSLQSQRTSIYNKKYFLAKLMKSEEQQTGHEQGDEEVEYENAYAAAAAAGPLKRRAKQTARNSTVHMAQQPRGSAPGVGGALRHRKVLSDIDFEIDYSDEEEDEDDDKVENSMELKQTLLHLLSTEINLNTRIYGEMTAFHSVFDSWNSLLPHETVCTVLKHLGVSQVWLEFFRNFLEAPLKFADDDSATTARKRRRGTPASHVLSEVFGETTLFCLDLAINQATSGCALWRIYDDFWFWSRDHDVAVKAWETVEKFASITGTEIDDHKTGTVRVSDNQARALSINKSLPQGEIRWGFLCLSPRTGQFEIDQKMVDSHINELHKQLHGKRKSVLAFIQAWNTYAATFFTSNFGKTANCFGRQHVDKMLATNERIQREVFSRLSAQDEQKISSVVEYLKKMIDSRFGVGEVPDGYLYFPMELGGLDLKSPFISLLQIRDAVLQEPSTLVNDFITSERKAYEKTKKSFDSGETRGNRYNLKDPDWVPKSAQEQSTFFTFEEYTRYREEFAFNHHYSGEGLCDVFNRLMQRPVEQSVDADDCTIWTALNHLNGQSNLRGINAAWGAMEPYWRWVAMMFGPEIVDTFGGLNVVDPGLLPMGMVTLFRDKRIKW